ncbi:MAG: hypothetical protein EOR01_23605 [Mesorhizobium sp.]|uniref:hypothetical protein n=1 Tax=Mesorhizobium sp. TaxID=1871066 RepID=UPI000FE565F8|nr:hypothetical protein [Mesorhizobium sp.]RWP18010.1 MAG: hypothetical protein EOR01_23605 [Mesorhizobium sp.]
MSKLLITGGVLLLLTGQATASEVLWGRSAIDNVVIWRDQRAFAQARHTIELGWPDLQKDRPNSLVDVTRLLNLAACVVPAGTLISKKGIEKGGLVEVEIDPDQSGGSHCKGVVEKEDTQQR